MGEYHKLYYLKNKDKYRQRYQKRKREESPSSSVSSSVSPLYTLHLKIVLFLTKYYPDVTIIISYTPHSSYSELGTPNILLIENFISIEFNDNYNIDTIPINTTMSKLQLLEWNLIISKDYTHIIHTLTKLL